MQQFKMYADPSIFPNGRPAAVQYTGAGLGELADIGALDLYIRDKDDAA